MELNIDKLINFYKDYYKQNDSELTEEGEEPSAAPEPSTPSPSVSAPSGGGGDSGGSSGGSGKQTKVWDGGVQRGPANPIGNAARADKVTRGKANPVGNTVWSSGITKGRANPSDFV